MMAYYTHQDDEESNQVAIKLYIDLEYPFYYNPSYVRPAKEKRLAGRRTAHK